jgi:membrane-associated protease RseP (regulator of RpoE activity)
MAFWFFLLLLAISSWLTYMVIERQVKTLTRTPIWMLWLVLMLPVFSMTLWMMGGGDRRALPLFFFIFVASFVGYVALIQKGRIPPTERTLEEAMPLDLPIDQPVTRPINEEEEQQLRDCFPWGIYHLNRLEFRPQAVICTGQLRTEPEAAYKTIQSNVRQIFGDRFLVLFQEGTPGKPVFVMVANPQLTPEGQMLDRAQDRPLFGLLLAGLSFISATWAGCEILRQTLKPTQIVWTDGVSYACAWMGFFLVRELGHYFMAKRYKLPVTLPYFFPFPPVPPFPPIGTLGAYTRLLAPMPSRKALFDIRAIGSLGGMAVAIGLLIWGLAHSTVVLESDRATIFDFEGLKPKYSLLLALLSKAALGTQIGAKQAIALHPVAFAGWLGLLFSAFNLMPIGTLDGGRLVHAVYGQRTGAMIGNVARLLLLLLSLAQMHLVLWAVLLFFLPTMDEPALNDVTELNGWRDMICLVALVLVTLVILPAPPSLLVALGMG